MAGRVALVTGSNKGIGYALVEELLRRGVETVYLTARNEQKGRDAVQRIREEGFRPEFHQLDVTDKESIKACADSIKSKHGGLDILINNAGVITAHSLNIKYEDAKQDIAVNYKGILSMELFFFPILNENARVINVSSNCGHLSNIRNENWIARLTKEDLKKNDIEDFVNWFLESVKTGSWKAEDFSSTILLSYTVSKVALSALTRVQQKEIDRNISINSIHPGFVKTGMTLGAGIMTAKEASKAVVFLALDVEQSVKGKYFWFDKTEVVWEDPTLLL